MTAPRHRTFTRAAAALWFCCGSIAACTIIRAFDPRLSTAEAKPPKAVVNAAPCSVSVLFTPGDNCTARIVQELAAAKQSVRVQAYSFTSAPIAQAIVAALKRGVDVEVILDKSHLGPGYSEARFLANSGVPCLIDGRHAIAHNKIMIIDGRTVITGSFNFTKAAQDKNAENLVVFNDMPAVADAYTRNYNTHRAHSSKP